MGIAFDRFVQKSTTGIPLPTVAKKYLYREWLGSDIFKSWTFGMMARTSGLCGAIVPTQNPVARITIPINS